MSKNPLDSVNFSLPDLQVLNTSKLMQEVIDNMQPIEITPISEIISEQLEPLIENEEKVIQSLTDNYNKLNDMYKLKEQELKEAKKDNKNMKWISLISAIIAGVSLLATILIGVL